VSPLAWGRGACRSGRRPPTGGGGGGGGGLGRAGALWRRAPTRRRPPAASRLWLGKGGRCRGFRGRPPPKHGGAARGPWRDHGGLRRGCRFRDCSLGAMHVRKERLGLRLHVRAGRALLLRRQLQLDHRFDHHRRLAGVAAPGMTRGMSPPVVRLLVGIGHGTDNCTPSVGGNEGVPAEKQQAKKVSLGDDCANLLQIARAKHCAKQATQSRRGGAEQIRARLAGRTHAGCLPLKECCRSVCVAHRRHAFYVPS